MHAAVPGRRAVRLVAILLVTITTLANASLSAPVEAQEPDPRCPVAGIDDRCEAWTVETEHGDNCCDADWVRGFHSSRHFVATEQRLFLALPVNDPDAASLEERYDWQVSAFAADGSALLWQQRLEGPDWDFPLSVTLGPDERRVYVTGYRDYPASPNVISFGFACDVRLMRFGPVSAMTVAFDADTGEELWRSGSSSRPFLSAAFDSALSPDGNVLYQVGIRLAGDPELCQFDAAITALDAASGEELWGSVIASGDPDRADFFVTYRIDVSADGRRAVVAGASSHAATGGDFLTAAVDLGDDPGQVLWIDSYDHADGDNENMKAMAYDPQHDRVVVTGTTHEGNNAKCSVVFNASGCEQYRFATVAYDASSGERLWTAHYEGPALDYSRNTPRGIDISPDGSRVFVTGESIGVEWPDWDYATVAYDTATGEELWVSRYGTPVGIVEWPSDVRVNPDGETLYVTGVSANVANVPGHAATVAYDTATGRQLWVARHGGDTVPADRTRGDEMAISPDGARLYVSGLAVDTTAVMSGGSTTGRIAAYDLE